MAKATASRSSESAGIPRRSWGRRRPDAVADEPVDLGHEEKQDLVKTVRKEEIKEGGEKRWRGNAGLHRKRSSTAAASGGTASSCGGSLGAPGCRVEGQNGEEEVGVKREVVARPLPSAVVQIEEGSRRGAGGRAPARGGRADGWDPRGREREERVRVGWSWAVACWAGSAGLFPFFFFFFFF